MRPTNTRTPQAAPPRRPSARALGRMAAVAAALLLALPAGAKTDRPERTEEIGDAGIAIRVEADLLADDGVPAHRVDVSVENGIVTLSGTVDSMPARQRAVGLARSVKGVVRVVDQLVVDAMEREDEALAADVGEALFLDPAAEATALDVTANEGVVTLAGTVDSFAEKWAALAAAQNVRGVSDIVDRIVVRVTGDRPDAEIAADIDHVLAADVRLDADRIEVAVADGEVTLTGVVGSAGERALAVRRAWVAGTRSVDADGLAVRWWEDAEKKAPVSDTERGEAAIRQAVEEVIRYHPRAAVEDLAVSLTGDGVVALRGEVKSLRARRTAGRLARDVVGVWKVRNLLRVRPGEETDDATLTKRVAAAMKRDPYVERHEILVSARGGKVYLHGTVDTDFERDRAAAVAAAVKGVTDLETYLGVRQAWQPKPDWAIERDVAQELWWSPIVDGDEIAVTVDEGVATLKGAVDTPVERRAAIAEAWQGGARNVVDELDVRLLP